MRKLMLLLAILGLGGLSWAASPFAGTWKLNVAKSNFKDPSAEIRSNIVKIEDLQNGLKFSFDIVDATGKAIHIDESPLFDGKDYPVKGDPASDMISLKRIDTNSFEVVTKKGGKDVQRTRVVIAKDGKSSTVTAKTKDAKGQEITSTSIYDKQ